MNTSIKNNLWFEKPIENIGETNPIKSFITDGVLNIDPTNWNILKSKYTREELEEYLIDAIYSGDIDLPYRECSVYDAISSFNKLLNYECRGPVEGKIFTKFPYRYKLNDLYIDEAVVGNVASDYFQQQNRFECGHVHFPSPAEVWHDKKQLHHLVGGLFTLNYDSINTSKLRSLIAMRCYIASQFRPAVAKSIYEYYNAENVLDFSSGWGDRLCGFYAAKCTKSYIGIDPNVKVYNNYYKQAELYSKLTNKKDVTFINKPAEDVCDLPENCVDLVFTSPPYFKTEKYSEDDTQSFKRYDEVDGWLTGFMYKTIDNVWKALKPGGHLVINISDAKIHGKRQHICDDMNDYIGTKPDSEYEMGFGMKLSVRPNSDGAKGEEDTELVEPVWVWKKVE